MRYKFNQYLRENRIDGRTLRGQGARSEVWQAWFREATRRFKIERVAIAASRVAKSKGIPDSPQCRLAKLAPGSPEAMAILSKHKTEIRTAFYGHQY